MTRKSIKSILLATLLLLLTGSVSQAAEPAKVDTSNKWRMSVSGNAESDGTIVLQLTPKDGTALTATIAISNKNGENDVAKAIVKALKAQLPKEQFHVERDDGEDVLIKKKGRHPDFGLVVVSNDVKNVRLSQRKE